MLQNHSKHTKNAPIIPHLRYFCFPRIFGHNHGYNTAILPSQTFLNETDSKYFVSETLCFETRFLEF